MMAPIVAAEMSGNNTDAMSTTDNVTRTATTAAVNRLVRAPFTQGPSTALSLHSNSRRCRRP